MIETLIGHDERTWLREASPDELEGRVLVVHSHQILDSDSLARVVDAQEIEDSGVGVKLVDCLTSEEHSGATGSAIPTISYPAEGATYRVYRLEHLNGRQEWVGTTPWLPSRFLAKGRYTTSEGYEGPNEYLGHEPQRVAYKEATYRGDLGDGQPDEAVEFSEGSVRVTYSTSSDDESDS